MAQAYPKRIQDHPEMPGMFCTFPADMRRLVRVRRVGAVTGARLTEPGEGENLPRIATTHGGTPCATGIEGEDRLLESDPGAVRGPSSLRCRAL